VHEVKAQNHRCATSGHVAYQKRICKHFKKDQCEEAVVAHEVVQHCHATASGNIGKNNQCEEAVVVHEAASRKRICEH